MIIFISSSAPHRGGLFTIVLEVINIHVSGANRLLATRLAPPPIVSMNYRLSSERGHQVAPTTVINLSNIYRATMFEFLSLRFVFVHGRSLRAICSSVMRMFPSLISFMIFICGRIGINPFIIPLPVIVAIVVLGWILNERMSSFVSTRHIKQSF